MDAEAAKTITTEFDRMIGMMGVGELRAEIRSQGKLLEEVRNELKSKPIFNPRLCNEQQADIDHVKTALFGPYDHPGGVVARVAATEQAIAAAVPPDLNPRLTDLEGRMKLLIWLVAATVTATLGILTYTVAELIVHALSHS